MFGQTHAALGWVVGTVAPGSDRRLRAWCTAAAILPDVDALAMLAGKEYYDRFHHTFGHNVFTGALCVAAAAWHFRGRWTSTALVAACFASHLLTDMKLSGWELHLLWPFCMRGWEFKPNLQRVHVTGTDGKNRAQLVCTQCIRGGGIRKVVQRAPFSVPQAAGK